MNTPFNLRISIVPSPIRMESSSHLTYVNHKVQRRKSQRELLAVPGRERNFNCTRAVSGANLRAILIVQLSRRTEGNCRWKPLDEAGASMESNSSQQWNLCTD